MTNIEQKQAEYYSQKIEELKDQGGQEAAIKLYSEKLEALTPKSEIDLLKEELAEVKKTNQSHSKLAWGVAGVAIVGGIYFAMAETHPDIAKESWLGRVVAPISEWYHSDTGGINIEKATEEERVEAAYKEWSAYAKTQSLKDKKWCPKISGMEAGLMNDVDRKFATEHLLAVGLGSAANAKRSEIDKKYNIKKGSTFAMSRAYAFRALQDSYMPKWDSLDSVALENIMIDHQIYTRLEHVHGYADIEWNSSVATPPSDFTMQYTMYIVESNDKAAAYFIATHLDYSKKYVEGNVLSLGNGMQKDSLHEIDILFALMSARIHDYVNPDYISGR